jgi:hypothetical protein
MILGGSEDIRGKWSKMFDRKTKVIPSDKNQKRNRK